VTIDASENSDPVAALSIDSIQRDNKIDAARHGRIFSFIETSKPTGHRGNSFVR
jgi:hypothetical protein